MTQSIENAFRERWQEYQVSLGLPGELPSVGEAERRVLFAAIAEGVLRHLRDHLPDEGTVGMSVTVEQEDVDGEPVQSRNVSERIPVKRQELAGRPTATGDFIEIEEALVSQFSDAIQSTGISVINSIEVEDLS